MARLVIRSKWQEILVISIDKLDKYVSFIHEKLTPFYLVLTYIDR